jgi:hypothetical protein
LAFDGNGNFVRLHNWTSDAANNIDINAGECDAEDNGFAAGLTLCVTRDGQGKMAADFLPSAASTYNLGTGGVPWLNIAAKSGTIGPPSSGNTWTANGAAGNYAGSFVGNSGAGVSYGVAVTAGTNASDICANFLNQAGNVIYAQIRGDGSMIVGTPTGGQLGLGTLNIATTLALAGNPVYAGIPQNAQSSNYTFVLADANKHIFHNSASAHTFTIPANASVAYPIGTAITVINGQGSGVLTLAITTDTLQWLPSGGSGSRTIAAFGQGTLIKIASTIWYLTGVGIT